MMRLKTYCRWRQRIQPRGWPRQQERHQCQVDGRHAHFRPLRNRHKGATDTAACFMIEPFFHAAAAYCPRPASAFSPSPLSPPPPPPRFLSPAVPAPPSRGSVKTARTGRSWLKIVLSVRPSVRSSSFSPTQRTGSETISIAGLTFLTTIHLYPQSKFLRSEWPTMEYSEPISAIIGPETAPVKAP